MKRTILTLASVLALPMWVLAADDKKNGFFVDFRGII